MGFGNDPLPSNETHDSPQTVEVIPLVARQRRTWGGGKNQLDLEPVAGRGR